MAKFARKSAEKGISTKKAKKTAKGRTKASDYLDGLLELHKLQGTLLVHLKKEIR